MKINRQLLIVVGGAIIVSIIAMIMAPTPINEINTVQSEISQKINAPLTQSDPLQSSSPLQASVPNGSLPFNGAMPISNIGPFNPPIIGIMGEWPDGEIKGIYEWTDWPVGIRNTITELLAQPNIIPEQLATIVEAIPTIPGNRPPSVIYIPAGNLPPAIYNPSNPTQQSPR